jgi:GT2 family glycosyltransferase/glycosyltransferase involved in cell wall biosynthesis
MRILHAIHDFLPRHQAGSEIYAFELAQAQRALGWPVHVLCADYDLRLRHGTLRWRLHDGIGVTELINNWAFASFRETYRSPQVNQQLRHALIALAPDVVHIHNLLNLSFDLPAIARELRIPTVATLHDYTLVCPSGGQRVHQAESHVCALIDPSRCSRCFAQHNFHARLTFGRLPIHAASRADLVGRVAGAMRRRVPRAFDLLVRSVQRPTVAGAQVTPRDIEERLDYVRRVFETIDLFIAPSPNLATEYQRLGLARAKLRVSDYGFNRFEPSHRVPSPGRLRIGFVGTLVWHKGVHVLLDALRALPLDRVELKIFGDTNTFPDYVARVRDQARGLPVRFMGRFERDRVTEVYAGIDVLVVSSLWPENSPLVIHEAFMAGVPTVGSRQGGTQDLIAHGVNGLLYDAFSPAALADALKLLIDDPGRVAQLAAAAPGVKSIEQDATECLRIYETLATERRSSAAVTRAAAGETQHRRTAAVLLNYQTPDDTTLALRSLEASRRPFRSVIVVDNGSQDGSESLLRARVRHTTFVANGTNLGFAGGCNVGIRTALEQGAERVLLINSDAILPPDTLEQLEDALDGDPGVGVAGPAIVSREHPEELVSRGIRFSPTTGRMRFLGHGERWSGPLDARPVVVDAVSGCAMLITRELIERIGLLSEDYFFGFEDLDYCLRARTAGYRTVYVPTATVLHRGSGSIGFRSPRRIYFATRNHLLLASRLSPAGPAAWFRAATTAIFNLAHALISSGVPRAQALRAFAEGLNDHLRGRYGQPPSLDERPQRVEGAL